MTTTDSEDETSRDGASPQPSADAAGDNLPSDPAARRFIWRDSAEYERFNKRMRRLSALPAVVAVPFFFMLTGILDLPLISTASLYLAFAVLGGTVWLTLFLTRFYEWRARRTFEARVSLGMAKKIADDEKDLAKRAVDGQLDLASLWALNQERIEYYHGIARVQSENSYKSAQVAGIVGFIAVLGLGALAAFATSGTASIAAAAVGVAGAAMSGYIGATFMKIQAEASSQFRQFFQEPVEVSRFLGAERLINTLGEEKEKAKAVQIVVSAMMTDTSTPSTLADS